MVAPAPEGSSPLPVQPGARLLSIIPEFENIRLFQIRPNGLSSDYANELNAVALSFALVQMSLEEGHPADPFSVKTLQKCIAELPTYTDFVINTLLPRTERSETEAVRNLTRQDFIEANPEAVHRLDELAELMRCAAPQRGDRLMVFPSTVADIGRQMSQILLNKETTGFVNLNLIVLTQGLLKDGGVQAP